MSNNIKTVFAVIIIIILGLVVYYKTKPTTVDTTPVVTETDSLQGCYVATLAKDVYTIKIASHTGDAVSGNLSFKNFEKDSSSGTFTGTYKDGILLGVYSFDSEGMHSNMQVIFKKTADGFVRGFGDVDSTGEKFTDLNKITYDTKYTFKPTPCDVASGKLPAGSSIPADKATLQASTWVWQNTIMSDGKVIIPNQQGKFTLKFGADGNATGKTDCNSYFASYQIGTDGVINFGAVGATKMFCEGSQESIFTTEISQATHYMIDASGNLVLMLPFDSGSILFKKQ